MNKTFLHSKFFRRAAFILGCFFFAGCENDPKVIEELTTRKVMAEEAKNIECYLSQGDHLKARLWAPHLNRYQADSLYDEFPNTLHVNFFDSAGKTESHLDALYGKYFENYNKVFLKDCVVVYNFQGDSLHCPELWWDQNQQRFYTDKKVRIKKGGNMIYGSGMTARQDLTDIHVLGQVTGTVPVPDSLNRK